MQWDDSNNAGFTAGSATWLPVSDTYRNINVQVRHIYNNNNNNNTCNNDDDDDKDDDNNYYY